MATITMKPLPKQTDVSVHPFSGFRNFMVAILRNRIFLLFLLVDALAFGLQWIDSRFALPQSFYFGFAFVGFAWSAFRAYRDLSLAYRNILSPKPVEKIARSELSVSFHSGNEYAYSISDPYAGQNLHITKMQKTKGVKCHFDGRGVFYINDKVYYSMAKASLTIHIRMENTGDLPLEILSIHVENNLDLNYLKLSDAEVFLAGKKLGLPLPLKSEEFVLLQAKYIVSTGKGSGNHLFAADFRALPRSIAHVISFNTRDDLGKEQTNAATIETPSKPLVDLYIKQWREFDQDEYLLMAGHVSAGDLK